MHLNQLLQIGAISATVLFTIITLLFEHRRRRGAGTTGVMIFKAAASLGFIGTGVAFGATETPFGWKILAAMILCLIGDMVLVSRAKAAFLIGLGSFLLAHLVYAYAFFSLGFTLQYLLPAIAGASVGIGIVLVWLWPHMNKRLRGPVIAYTVTIGVMVSFSVGSVGVGATLLAPAGAILFMMSDVLVGKDRFIDQNFWNQGISLPLYYSAQLLIAASVGATI